MSDKITGNKAKKNLSLDKQLMKEAENRARQLNLNFAAYITTLINKDLKKDSDDRYIDLIRKNDMYRGDKERINSASVMDAAESIMNMA